MKKSITVILCLAITSISVGAQVEIDVDFARGAGYPLSKTKIGLYQTPLTTGRWLQRDLPLLSELESRTMRYEIAWGKRDCFGYEMVRDENGLLRYDFSPVDLFTGLVAGANTDLFMCHCYNPVVAGAHWQDPPSDYTAFREVNREFARHWKDIGLQNHYIEIWNEPDLDVFFSGTLDDYLDIYKSASEGILEGNPDAKLGGPAGAFGEWFAPLLEKCATEGWPLHYLSGHNYGDPKGQLATMRRALVEAGRPDVELVLSEYAPYDTANGDTHEGGLVEKYEAAMTFFNAVENLLTYPDLTYVHWAQYIDAGVDGRTIPAGRGDKMGLIEGNTGARKALFNAFKMYGMLPVDRYELSSSSEAVRGFASADENNAGVVLWNTGGGQQTVNIRVNSLPFSTGRAYLYRIDPDHSWYETGNDALEILQTYDLGSSRFSWEGEIGGRSVIMIKFDDLSGASELDANPFAHIIRTYHWYPDRETATAYADFDSRTWITRLGMGENAKGEALVGVMAEDIPLRFRVAFHTEGCESVPDDGDAAMNFRIDFESAGGGYAASALFHGKDFVPQGDDIAWGTGRAPAMTVPVDMSGFDVNIGEYAPPDWTGRVIFTYRMKDTGPGSRAKVFMGSLES